MCVAFVCSVAPPCRFHGGLQFQVEHHLFPRLPRHNLRKARELVRAFCKKHDVEYKELGFFDGSVRLFRKMREVAHSARTLKKGSAGFYHSTLYEGMNAIG